MKERLLPTVWVSAAVGMFLVFGGTVLGAHCVHQDPYEATVSQDICRLSDEGGGDDCFGDCDRVWYVNGSICNTTGNCYSCTPAPPPNGTQTVPVHRTPGLCQYVAAIGEKTRHCGCKAGTTENTGAAMVVPGCSETKTGGWYCID